MGKLGRGASLAAWAVAILVSLVSLVTTIRGAWFHVGIGKDSDALTDLGLYADRCVLPVFVIGMAATAIAWLTRARG